MLNCYDILFFTIIIYTLGVVGWKLITARKTESPQRFELVKTNPRSSKWKAVRNNFIKYNGCCAVCGKTENLVVHHKQPFHLFPEKELDPTNLVTLCENDILNCHYVIGHLMEWTRYNPDIEEDIRIWKNKLNR